MLANSLFVAAVTHAAIVVADFNDFEVGNLNTSGTPAAGNNTGSGFSNPNWISGSTVVRIISSDLVAPRSTNYAVVQPATGGKKPRRALMNWPGNDGCRQQHRDLATPLSGLVWGSFLVNNSHAEQMAGLSFNIGKTGAAVATPNPVNGRWLVAKGTSLVIHKHGGATETVNNVFTLKQTALVLFSYDTAAKRLDVWVNPTLPARVEDLAPATPAYSSGATPCDLFGADNQLNGLGLIFYAGAATNYLSGIIDSVRLSSNQSGYYDVTGLPPPSGATAQPAKR